MKKSLFFIVLFSLIASSAWAHRYYPERSHYGYNHHPMYRTYPHARYWHQARGYHHSHRPIYGYGGYGYGYRHHGQHARIDLR